MSSTTSQSMPHPPIVTKQDWIKERKSLLAEEKALTQKLDRVNAMRRRLPMVALEKNYEFETSNGKQNLRDLFGDQQQLIVYHFMYDPEWERGCSGCTMFINALGDLSMLEERQTTFVVISRAPLEKLVKMKRDQGWDVNWVSSFGSDFNYDFHVTLDVSMAPPEYNFRSQEELESRKGFEPSFLSGEKHGLSVFFRIEDDIFHTYSAFARGCESKSDAYSLLDLTPYGRQEDFEDSPAGWPQRPTYGG